MSERGLETKIVLNINTLSVCDEHSEKMISTKKTLQIQEILILTIWSSELVQQTRK